VRRTLVAHGVLLGWPLVVVLASWDTGAAGQKLPWPNLGETCRRRRAQSDKGSSVNSLSRHSVNADYPLIERSSKASASAPR
jgi:hypothetical protein